jgi:4-amino-4-deoxy-L-arabinose transferase-like glycosyltransferase
VVRRSTLPLLLLAALSFLSGLGRGAIADTDEAFYAEASREMVESGDWLTPYFNYETRFQKPVLYYWLTSATYLALGPTETAARLWSALAGLALVAVTAACGRRWGDDDTGLLAGAIAATSFGYFALARMALPDLPLALCITVTIWTAFVATLERERRPGQWLLVSATAAALGFLFKGPLALVIPALVVVPALLIERRSFNLRAGDVLAAGGVFLALALPWYIAMWLTHGTAYLESFFVGDNFERFATSRFNDPRPWWFYLPVAAGGLLPWTPMAVVWFAPIGQFLRRRRDVGTIELRLLLWVALPLVFFTLSVGKQPRYILPVLPPLAVLLASSIVERTRDWRSFDGARMRPRPNRSVMIGALGSGALLVALAGLLYRAQPLFLEVSPATNIVAASAIALGGVSVMLVAVTQAWRLAPTVLALAAAVTFAVLPYATLAPSDRSAVRRLAVLVREARTGDEAIGTYKVFVRNLVFYTGIRQTDLVHDQHLLDWLATTPHALLVLRTGDVERLSREHGLAFQTLATLSYFDEGGLRVGTLLWPNPVTDLDQVAVVRVTARSPRS